MKIPVFSLARQHERLKEELMSALQDVLKKDIFILGEHVAMFEREFAAYVGAEYAVGVGNGTEAISLALLALGFEPGDEVIMPANSYPSVFGVTQIGVVPRLVDIDPVTFLMDPTKLEKVITKKTKAIMPVHLYGQPVEMEKIMEIGEKHGLPVVEDCAQAAGAEVDVSSIKYQVLRMNEKIHNTKSLIPDTKKQVWARVGSIGRIGCYSFYPTKNLGALGDGGMVVTNDKDLYEKVKLLRMYGEKDRYVSIVAGRNSRLDELQAAFLKVKLRYLDEWVERRREIAETYQKSNIKDQIYISNIKNPQIKHAYHLFVLRSQERDKLKAYLAEKGVGTGIHYPVAIHMVPSMKYLGYSVGDFPESEKACREVLSLPMYPELTDEEVGEVITALREWGM